MSYIIYMKYSLSIIPNASSSLSAADSNSIHVQLDPRAIPLQFYLPVKTESIWGQTNLSEREQTDLSSLVFIPDTSSHSLLQQPKPQIFWVNYVSTLFWWYSKIPHISDVTLLCNCIVHIVLISWIAAEEMSVSQLMNVSSMASLLCSQVTQ